MTCCLAALQKLRGRAAAAAVEAELDDMREEERAEQAEGHLSVLTLFTFRSLRWQLISVIVLMAGQQLSGINAVHEGHPTPTEQTWPDSPKGRGGIGGWREQELPGEMPGRREEPVPLIPRELALNLGIAQKPAGSLEPWGRDQRLCPFHSLSAHPGFPSPALLLATLPSVQGTGWGSCSPKPRLLGEAEEPPGQEPRCYLLESGPLL